MSCRDPVIIKSICAKCERTAGLQEAEQASEKKVFGYLMVDNLVSSRHARSPERGCVFAASLLSVSVLKNLR